jgi:hypothetical protein
MLLLSHFNNGERRGREEVKGMKGRKWNGRKGGGEVDGTLDERKGRR